MSSSSYQVVPSSLLVEIHPFLTVANEVEPSNPRVAYLCRFTAFKKAHLLDPSSRGQGVRQFKLAFLQRLKREGKSSLMGRAQCDSREMLNFYQHFCNKYIQTAGANKPDRNKLKKAYQTANILFEVVKTVNQNEESVREELRQSKVLEAQKFKQG